MRRTTIAASSRSPRYFGKILPVLGSPTWWPARPTRWMPRATEPGDSTSTTRSTVPMSMPSSRLDVATMPRSRPSFSSDSTCTRCSRASEPWCARTSSSPASSLRLAASRSARRRALQNTIVVRCARMSSRMRGCTCGQMLLCGFGIVEAEHARGRARRGGVRAGFVHVVDRDDHLDVERLARSRVDDRDRSLAVRRRSRRGSARSRRAGVAWPTARCVAAARR